MEETIDPDFLTWYAQITEKLKEDGLEEPFWLSFKPGETSDDELILGLEELKKMNAICEYVILDDDDVRVLIKPIMLATLTKALSKK